MQPAVIDFANTKVGHCLFPAILVDADVRVKVTCKNGQLSPRDHVQRALQLVVEVVFDLIWACFSWGVNS